MRIWEELEREVQDEFFSTCSATFTFFNFAQLWRALFLLIFQREKNLIKLQLCSKFPLVSDTEQKAFTGHFGVPYYKKDVKAF
jgi:hypothetical protein